MTNHKPRKCWRTGDIDLLARLWAAHVPMPEIALRMERSWRSIEQKVAKLRRSGDTRFPHRQEAWTPGQQRVIAEQVDVLIALLSSRLGRTRGAVAYHIAHAAIAQNKRERARKMDAA